MGDINKEDKKPANKKIDTTAANKKMTNKTTSTPYDDVFRTLLNDCSSLIIPVINEVFSEHYTGKKEIINYIFSKRTFFKPAGWK